MLNLLLIEDNPGDALLLRESLADLPGQDFQVEVAERLSSAVERLQNGCFDLVLADLGLPDSVGIDTVEALRSAHGTVPIVVLTGADDDARALAAINAGAQDYMVKGRVNGELLGRALRYARERGRILAELKDSQERFALAVEGSRDGIWDWRAADDALYLSRRCRDLLGSPDAATAIAGVWPQLLPGVDELGLDAALGELLEPGTAHFEHELDLGDHAGRPRWLLVRGVVQSDHSGAIERMSGSLTDVTLRHQAEDRLRHEALHDALTGLMNRVSLLRLLERLLAHDAPDSFGLLFIDLDGFKGVNDSLGHEAGDSVLRTAAQRIESCCRVVDRVARLGGDEFVVVVPALKGGIPARLMGQRIIAALEAPFCLPEGEVSISASIGVVESEEYSTADAMLRDADTAMYDAKTHGRGRVRQFDGDLQTQVDSSMQLEDAVRNAVERRQLEPHFQPIIDITSGHIVGFEALARLTLEDGSLLRSASFIPTAERSGFDETIGARIIEIACAHLRRWLDRGVAKPGFYVSVNLSRRQLLQPRPWEPILASLQGAGLGDHDLVLEVDSALVEADVRICEAVSHLAEHGLKVLLDGFGSSPLSISRFEGLPVDTVKVDMLTAGRGGDALHTGRVAMAAVSLATSLGREVVAKRIETPGQLAKLRTLGCRFGQGFLFSDAVSATDAAHMLQNDETST